MAQGSQCHIKCRARPGLFLEEMIVSLRTLDSKGRSTSATCLAYGDSIERKGEPDKAGVFDASLKAYCMDRSADVAAVVLPQPTFENGPSVFVPASDLME